MSDQMTVLFANEAYYAAFQSGNYETMETLWARSFPVTCIHPGANNLSGWELVMESWKSILTNDDLVNMEIVNPRANVYGEVAVVVCYEVFQEVTLVATNIFVKEENHWKMVHHQAGGSPMPPLVDPGYEESTTLQ